MKILIVEDDAALPNFIRKGFEAEHHAMAPCAERGLQSTSALRRARLAVARRLLETAGASLIFGNGAAHGFVLRVPHLSH